LGTFGQSIWLDYIRRDLITSGQLRCLIEEDGLRGMTSNPSIFEKAIVDSHEYDEDIRAMAGEGKDVKSIYETLSQRDVQSAADEFRSVYDKTDGHDGYVSLEVNPHLAHDTKGTVEEAHRLWKMLARPNVFIKVPATTEGLSAIQELISEGINVNVTLLFGLPRYRQVADAYLTGLAARAARGKPVNHVASVASFFVSRLDVLVDSLLENKIQATDDKAKQHQLRALRGKAAIANARLVYEAFRDIFSTPRFAVLARKGGHMQRPLWASTSTKNPAYRDVLYAEELIGPNTVDTMPLETIENFRDHGHPHLSIENDLEQAKAHFAALEQVGISYQQVTEQLLQEGVHKFADSFQSMYQGTEKKEKELQADKGTRF